MPELRGRLTPQGNLGGTLNTIVYASNYNVLDNKPSINSVTLQGNKTASDLGLAVPADITVTSVNGETGAVVLDGSDINYDVNTTVNSKLDDLQSQIDNSGVLAVNGKTGVVILTGTDINYSAGVTLNAKIDAVEAEIPTVNYPVTSVNGETGAVVLDGSDIKYDTNTTINAKIDEVEAEIPTVDYPVTSVNGETGTVVLDGTDINYDTNTTVNAKIDAVQGSIPTTDNDISHYTGTPTAGTTAEAIGAKADASDIPYVEYKEVNVSFDSAGEGTLFTSKVYVLSTQDLTSDSKYIGYANFFRGNQTKVKPFNLATAEFTSANVVSTTRKIGVWYLKNITTQNA